MDKPRSRYLSDSRTSVLRWLFYSEPSRCHLGNELKSSSGSFRKYNAHKETHGTRNGTFQEPYITHLDSEIYRMLGYIQNYMGSTWNAWTVLIRPLRLTSSGLVLNSDISNPSFRSQTPSRTFRLMTLLGHETAVDSSSAVL